MDLVIQLGKVQGQRKESTLAEVLSEILQKMCMFRVLNIK